MWKRILQSFLDSQSNADSRRLAVNAYLQLPTIALTLLIGRFLVYSLEFQNVKANLIEFFRFHGVTFVHFILCMPERCYTELVFFYYARFYGEKAE